MADVPGIVDGSEGRLLSLVQRAFPLDARPFAALGETLGVAEDDVLARVSDLKARRIIRQIGGIFDSRRLGYQSSLVAARVPPESLEGAAAAISRHPGVSHNYERAHAFNLWFTLTVPGGVHLQAEVDRLGRESGASAVRLFPTLRTFKIGVILDMGGGDEPAPSDRHAAPPPQAPPKSGRLGGAEAAPTPPKSGGLGGVEARPLSEREIAAVRVLQRDLPMEPRPFLSLASDAGMGEAELLGYARRFLEGGEMRRFAAVLFHRRAGFTANGMVVWNVPSERVAAVGEELASYAAVSHCYQRPSYPDWPYSLFTMVHARSPEECERVVAEMAEATGIHDHATLYSLREFKKVRVRYFEE